ncbi:hypothetical protein BGZ73_005695, partial [Actinomortierella ambigua]
PKDKEALVKIKAVALNHRDVWIIDDSYSLPKDTSSSKGFRVGDRVLIMPSVGWLANPRGPEPPGSQYEIRGGSRAPGVFTQLAAVEEAELFKAPKHLTDIEAAGLSLSGLTAYRAVFTKGQVTKGQHVLVTGIGGGVALFALQYAAAVGANVYVTSSNEAKIERAKQYGAKGGVNYRHAKWDKELLKLTDGQRFDVVIDSVNGANTMTIIDNVLNVGGALVSFGQTAGSFELEALYFVRQIEIKGTTMGSRAEFEQMLAFITKHEIRSVVGDVFEGIDKILRH